MQTDTAGHTKGLFKCVKLSSGQEMWSSERPGHSSVLLAGKTLVLFSEKGVLTLAHADASGYREISRRTIFENQMSWTPPAIYEGHLILRSHKEMACLYLGTEPLDASEHATVVTRN